MWNAPRERRLPPVPLFCPPPGGGTGALVPAYSALAPAYDLAVGVRDFAHARASFERLVETLGIRFSSAVDLGCGTGLFACYLARRWRIPVLAVDNSPAMLAVARGRCTDPNVRFLLQDMRWLRLPWRVDLATANTFTLNHLLTCADLVRTFRRIAGALRAGGHLVFDLITDRQPWKGRRWYARRLRVPGGELGYRLRWDPGRRLLQIQVVHRAHGRELPQIEVYVGRGYSPVQVSAWLRQAGFALLGVYDASTLRIASATAPRVVLVARKVSPAAGRPASAAR